MYIYIVVLNAYYANPTNGGARPPMNLNGIYDDIESPGPSVLFAQSTSGISPLGHSVQLHLIRSIEEAHTHHVNQQPYNSTHIETHAPHAYTYTHYTSTVLIPRTQ